MRTLITLECRKRYGALAGSGGTEYMIWHVFNMCCAFEVFKLRVDSIHAVNADQLDPLEAFVPRCATIYQTSSSYYYTTIHM